MKKIVYILIGILVLSSMEACKIKPNKNYVRVSPAKTTHGDIGNCSIQIDYSSPFVKEREIFGALVPYEQIWRAGANEATIISFSKAVTIGGKPLGAGRYTFFVIPKKEGDWTIIFNNKLEQWGAFQYKEKHDALRSTAQTENIDKLESLRYKIENNFIYLDWANTRVKFEVVTQ